jgi:hypothetical protein
MVVAGFSLYTPANSWPDIFWISTMIASVASRRALPLDASP